MEKDSIPYYLEQFKKFCEVNDISSDSSSSYVVYIEAAYKYLCPLVDFEYEGKIYNAQILLENIDRLIKNASGRGLVIFLFEVLSNIKFDELKSTSITKKYLSNIKTALRWFLSYMIAVCEDKKNTSQTKKESDEVFGSFNANVAKTILKDLIKRYPSTKSIFTKSDLIKIFTARMLTQDRVKGNYAVELPIRKISSEISYHKKQNKLFKDKNLSQWIRTFLIEPGKVKFIVSEDGLTTVDLNDITSLSIDDNGKVTVKAGKNPISVFTEIYEKKESSGFISFEDLAKQRKKPTEIRNLALDHDEPIFNVLKKKAALLKVLKKFNAQDGHLEPEECEDLFKEFIMIHEDVAFTIMDQKENVKKGKNK